MNRRQLYIATAEEALLWLLAESQVDDDFRVHKTAIQTALQTLDSLKKSPKLVGQKPLPNTKK